MVSIGDIWLQLRVGLFEVTVTNWYWRVRREISVLLDTTLDIYVVSSIISGH